MLIEKLMSGLYMGENARRILLSFARDAQLFGGFVPEPLTRSSSFTTAGRQQQCGTPGASTVLLSGPVATSLLWATARLRAWCRACIHSYRWQ
jgi:hypothetical protein